jgi:serine/threonine-protein kinase
VLLGKPLALKALRADLATDSEIAQRFIHEARTAASVSHPGLVQISDFGTLPTGQPYLVMELLEGVPLSALLRRYGALAPARAAAIVRKVAEAVQVAHDAGIVHRDLKPDNIQVRVGDAVDEVRIVDFGLAKVVGGSRFTRQGVVFGTPHYMSPEQASGESIDPRTDVYAVGVVLYEMLTGRVPFEADTYMGVLTQHIYMKPVPPSERLGVLDGAEALEAVALRCLEKQPARRYASMAALIAALDAIAPGSLPTEPLGIAEPLPSTELARGAFDSGALPLASERKLWPLAVGGLLVCAVLGGLAVRALLAPGEQATLPSPSAAPAARVAPQIATPVLSAERAEPAAPPVGGVASAQAVPAEVPRAPSARPPPQNLPRPRASQAAARKPPRRGDIIDPWANR